MFRSVIGQVVALSLLLLCTCEPAVDSPLRQNNAVWSEGIYFRGYRPSTGEKLTDLHIVRYAETLKKNGIKYAYIFAGPYGDDGRLPQFAFSELAVRSVKLIKEYYPDLMILPWVGGIQNKTVYLGDSAWVSNALADTRRIVEVLNVPGVHIDFEFILPGDPYLDQTIGKPVPGDLESYGKNVNDFHRRLRSILPDAFVSSVVTATSPGTRPWKRKTTLEELNVLLNYVDQISFLFYDTHIGNHQEFADNCKIMLNDISEMKNGMRHHDVQYLVAIGTFVNTPELHKYRDLEIESIENTLSVLRKSQIDLDASNNTIDGIAIFCDWETDETEWKAFNEFWVAY